MLGSSQLKDRGNPYLSSVFYDSQNKSFLGENGVPLEGSVTSSPSLLKNFNGARTAPNSLVMIKDKNVIGDNAGGLFIYTKDTSYAVDGGIIFATADGGRLVRYGYNSGKFDGIVDARWFGIKTDFVSYANVGTDNSPALILIAAALNSGVINNVQFPSGAMYTTAGMPHLTTPATLLGQGGQRTRFYLAKAMSGDMFSFGECWNFNEYNTTTPPAVNSKPGGVIRGINVVGAGVSTVQDAGVYRLQRGLCLYDRCDSFFVQDFSCDTLTGSAIKTGYKKNTAFGYMRVTNFYDIRVKSSGIAGVEPVMDLYSEGTGDSTNQCFFYDIKIVYPYTQALKIHNSNTDIGLRNINFFGMMMHGIVDPATPPAFNLVEIGSATLAGTVSGIRFVAYSGAASYVDQYAMAFIAPSAASCPYGIQIDGGIASGAGGGILVQYGKQIQLNLNEVTVAQNSLNVGPGVTGFIDLFGWPWENSATDVVVDATVLTQVRRPLKSAKGIVADSAGNPRGADAIDFQTQRANVNQVASGSNSAVLSGNSNQAGATNAVVIGGNACQANGSSSVAAGFSSVADGDFSIVFGRGGHSRGRTGTSIHASGTIAANGDAQANSVVFRRQSVDATPVILTAENNAPNGQNINNLNRPNQVQAVTGQIVGYDAATGNAAYWSFNALIKRPTADVTTTAVVGAPTATKLFGDAGTATWGTPLIQADNVNGGLKITCTGIAATTINWVCEIRGPEMMS